ncbi:hypothetical protein D0869_10478 [Hortaea werneckii]|uniref:ER membrane protein complex subunit 7 beta-sandwich domain-containing protein n=1 Tax=Hortaea werneckii TaxID=91943 RepID=A0A3M6WDZ8_HORWE|nr:hypothetical protein D0869_10478 [Hortaea werneckii]
MKQMPVLEIERSQLCRIAKMLVLWSLSALVCASVASAARLTVSIPASPPLLPNPATLPSSAHAVLVGPPGVQYDVPIRRDSSFTFPDLAEASYLLTIHSRDHFFPPLRVDVTNAAEPAQPQTIQAWQTFRGNEWTNKGPHYGTGKGDLHIMVQPSSMKSFYAERTGFSLFSFLKSPMILMALVSGVMIFGMPYLMDNSKLKWLRIVKDVMGTDQATVDPETKAEFEEMQKKGPMTGSQGAGAQMQNFDFAGWMAGKGAGAESGSSGGGSKRR